MQALKYDLLDYDSFQTAKMFNQHKQILSFFRKNWGEVSYPDKFKINYHCVNVWASVVDKTNTELLRELTEQYAASVSNAYSKLAAMLKDASSFQKTIDRVSEATVLAGGSLSKETAQKHVNDTVSMSIWEQLTEKCGHSDLLGKIKKHFPDTEELNAKTDVDFYLTEQLTSVFEVEREARVTRIMTQRKEAKARAEEAARLQEAKRRKMRKLVLKVSLVLILIIAVFLIVSVARTKIIIPVTKLQITECEKYNGETFT